MADEQNIDVAEGNGSSTVEQSRVLSTETPAVSEDVSSPIPGFPPLFQFAKLQTEASAWNSSLSTATGFTRCSDAITDKTTSSNVDTGVSYDNTVDSLDLDSAAAESVPVDGLEVIKSMEKSENVPEQEEEGDHEDPDKEEDDGVINDEPDEEEAESDPYFYTKRDEFTSEIYKIELQNLPKKCGYKVRYILNSYLS